MGPTQKAGVHLMLSILWKAGYEPRRYRVHGWCGGVDPSWWMLRMVRSVMKHFSMLVPTMAGWALSP